MKGDIDDVQIRYRGQLYRRITIKPHIRADGSTTQLATTGAGRDVRRRYGGSRLQAEAVAWHNQRVPT
jgi:hypothetical protein